MSIFPVMTTEAGQCVAFPDVCKTPSPGGPIPIPYPNIAACADGQGSGKVKVRGNATLRKGDKILRSTGDQAGSLMGVVSSTMMGPAVVKAGDSKVKVENKDLAHLTVQVGQNGNNANAPLGLQVVLSQAQVKVLGAPPPGRLAPFEVPLWFNDVLLDLHELLRCAPTLIEQLVMLQEDGWSIGFGEKGDSSCAIRKKKTILMDPEYAKDPARMLGVLSHEVGHALYLPPRHRSSGMLQKEWLDANLKERMRDEGVAALNNVRTKHEVEERCPGTSIPVSGDDGAHTFEKIEGDPELSEEQKRDAIATLVAEGMPDGRKFPHLRVYTNQLLEAWFKNGWGAAVP